MQDKTRKRYRRVLVGNIQRKRKLRSSEVYRKQIHCQTIRRSTGVNPGGDTPPLFWVGDGLYKHPPPPLFEDKITLNLTFIVKKLTFFNCKTIKISKNHSLAPLARTQMYSETRSLRICQNMYSFLDIIYVKGVE